MLALKQPPRGLGHYENSAPQVISGSLLMVMLSSYLLWQDILIFSSWAELFEGLCQLFGVDGSVALSREGGVAVSVRLPSGLPSMWFSGWLAVGVSAAAALASFIINANNVPGRYALRALALILGLPALGYLGLGIEPGLNVEAHVANVFRLGFWFIVLIPLVFAATGFVLPGNLARKAVWTLVAMLYFYTNVPVLALLHWQVLTLAGPAWAPALNVLLTVLLMSFHLVAFYGLVASTED